MVQHSSHIGSDSELPGNDSMNSYKPWSDDLAALQSLRDLCLRKLLERVLHSKTPDRDFSLYEPRIQQFLFGRLRSETLELQQIERDFKQITQTQPYIDTELYLHPRARERRPMDYIEDEFPFVEDWSYIEIDVTDEPETDSESPTIRWNTYQLYSDSPSSDLEVCLHDEYRCSECCPATSRSIGNTRKSVAFYDRISSQLLLYRITATYGMPPADESDGYKSCWTLELKYSDGSVLQCEDYKGAAHVTFRGTQEGSDNALKLLTYLTGTECVHTYDGIVAGTVA